jgi:hypothetical protein
MAPVGSLRHAAGASLVGTNQNTGAPKGTYHGRLTRYLWLMRRELRIGFDFDVVSFWVSSVILDTFFLYTLLS